MSEKRFEMVTVEDPLWEYGTHLKEVLQDNLTGKQYRAVSRLVGLLNEQQATITKLKEINKDKEQDVLHLYKKNEQLKQEIKQYWKCRDKWKQEAKELKKEADYFERKKCEYWNMYNEAHLDRIILKKENEQLKIANAKWLDKSLQDRQIRYSNTNHKELTKKYLLLKEENEQLRKQCFELEKDYLIETSDISDKIYLDDEIKELKQKYGV